MNETLKLKLKEIHNEMLAKVNTYLTQQQNAVCQLIESEIGKAQADDGCRKLIETYLDEADMLKDKLFEANRFTEKSFSLLDESHSYASDAITGIEEALNTLDEMTRTIQDTYKEAA